jgi:cephalosporin-C deacetylase
MKLSDFLDGWGTEPADFDAFWTRTLAEVRQHPLSPEFRAVGTPFELLDVFDVTFSGFGGHRVRAWLRIPRGVPSAVVLHFRGYGWGRGHATDLVPWPLVGAACVTLDTRGQGASGVPGDTPDPAAGTGPEQPGFLTRGIRDPHDYYYRRVFSDAVRAVEAAHAFGGLADLPTFAFGGSQGGGIALAVAGLTAIDGVLADVPFLSDFPRAVALASREPMLEVVRYLAAQRDDPRAVFQTLSYFDAVHHARRASAPALFSVGLRDATCPPETVFAAFDSYGGPKEIAVYPFNDHEGGEGVHEARKLSWLREQLTA